MSIITASGAAESWRPVQQEISVAAVAGAGWRRRASRRLCLGPKLQVCMEYSQPALPRARAESYVCMPPPSSTVLRCFWVREYRVLPILERSQPLRRIQFAASPLSSSSSMAHPPMGLLLQIAPLTECGEADAHGQRPPVASKTSMAGHETSFLRCWTAPRWPGSGILAAACLSFSRPSSSCNSGATDCRPPM